MGDPPAGRLAAANSKKRPSSEDDGVTGNVAKKVLAQNPFHGLEQDDAGDLLAKMQRNRKQKKPIIQEETSPERKEKCPPIFVYGDPTDLRPDLRQLISRGLKCTFRLCIFGVKLMTEGKVHYDLVVKYLTDKQYQYFTHDVPGLKPLKVVLHGLDAMDEAELMEELVNCGLKPSAVFKIVRHDKSRTYRDQLYLVHLEHGSINLKELKTHNRINSTVVEWVRYKPKHRDVTQCMNCLRFGHGTRNCAMNARCNRCGDNHGIDECTRMEEADPKCANCGENHRATTKACKKRAEFIEIRNRASMRNQPNRNKASSGVTVQNHAAINRTLSGFPALPALPPSQRLAAAAASVPAQGSSSQSPPAPSINQWASPPGLRTSQLNGESTSPQDGASLFKAEQLLPIFEDMAVRMRSCKTKYDQIYTLGMLLIQYAY